MFAGLGKLISAYPRWVLAGWLILTLLALPLAARVGNVLTAQPGDVQGSTADEVRDRLIQEFDGQDQHTVLLLSHSDDARIGTPAFDQPYEQLIQEIEALPHVHDIRDHRTSEVLPLKAENGHFVISVLGIDTADTSVAKATVDDIREVLSQVDGLETSLAGGPATTRELEEISERDARRAELFGLPLSLLVLFIAFGALVASGLPLLVAVASITLSFAALLVIGQVLEFAVFTQSIVTMLGLATGIDYALLMVNRYREEFRRLHDPRKAAAVTAETAGKAVAFSGLTVLIALSALLIPPLNFIRSIGIGAMVVLLVSVLVSVTALPSLLALLGRRVNWIKLTRREPGQRSRPFWERRAKRVMRHPWRWTIGATIFLVLLGLPAQNMQLGDPDAEGLSEQTDARQVQMALDELDLSGYLQAYNVLIDLSDQENGFFGPRSVRKISEFTRAVQELEHVESVLSPTTSDGVPGLFLYQYYASRENALQSPLADLVQMTVGTSGGRVLVKAFPEEDLTPQEGRVLARNLRRTLERAGLEGLVGGDNVGESEWADVLYSKFPLAVGIVYLMTLLLLGLAFRSLLIPIKSILLNTLTVAASFGVITLIFQYGVGAELLGVSGGLGFIDTSVPIFIFAIVFGLSMDYEVFMVARIYEAHQRGLSDKDAVAEALSATGGVISSAATVMIVVFSLFIFSEVILVKTLGLGLSVAVFLDATLVRLVLVPAVMSLAGRWNWWLPRPARRIAERLDLSHE